MAPALTADPTAPKINDLRSALDLLRQHPGQLIETDHIVDPNGELAGVYKRIGAGATVARPTRIGPAMIFNNVKGYPGSRVLVGMLPAASASASCSTRLPISSLRRSPTR